MKLDKRKLGRAGFAALTVGVCLTGIIASAPDAEAKLRPPYACPDVWSPVVCPNGQIYSNSCYASLAGQTGCVPWGGWLY